MRQLTQAVAMTGAAIRSIPARLSQSIVIVFGMGCATCAFVSILSMSAGLLQATIDASRPDRAMVLSQGATGEGDSSISRDNVTAIINSPGVKHDANGEAFADASMHASVMLLKRADGLFSFLTVSGVGARFLSVRPEIKLTRGRMFVPGRYELVVGEAAERTFSGISLGDRIDLPGGAWQVVGAFASGSTLSESQLLTDAATLSSSMRSSDYKSVLVQLTSPEAFQGFQEAIASNPALNAEAIRQTDYSVSQSKDINSMIQLIAFLVGGFMGLGAMFGTLNVMFTAVSVRSVEMGTMRAIGFQPFAILFSVLAESLLLAVTGAISGTLLAWLAVNGHLKVLSGVAIKFTVTPEIAAQAIGLACLLGLLGGFLPAVKAMRATIVSLLTPL